MNPTQKTPVRGLYFDFNYGLRVKVPKGEYRIRFVDMNDQVCLFDQVCSDNFVSSKKKYFLNLRLEVFRKAMPLTLGRGGCEADGVGYCPQLFIIN